MARTITSGEWPPAGEAYIERVEPASRIDVRAGREIHREVVEAEAPGAAEDGVEDQQRRELARPRGRGCQERDHQRGAAPARRTTLRR
ncbi:MAG: hypothetical protein ACE5JG_00710, partial [Planctomycetota bacterium]